MICLVYSGISAFVIVSLPSKMINWITSHPLAGEPPPAGRLEPVPHRRDFAHRARRRVRARLRHEETDKSEAELGDEPKKELNKSEAELKANEQSKARIKSETKHKLRAGPKPKEGCRGQAVQPG